MDRKEYFRAHEELCDRARCSIEELDLIATMDSYVHRLEELLENYCGPEDWPELFKTL